MSSATLDIPPPSASIPDRTFSAGQLAEIFGVHRLTILDWAKRGIIPRGRRFGRSLRWTPSDISPLLAERGA
jgi:predicted DNA-binding transcriptional regulator AlpA